MYVYSLCKYRSDIQASANKSKVAEDMPDAAEAQTLRKQPFVLNDEDLFALDAVRRNAVQIYREKKEKYSNSLVMRGTNNGDAGTGDDHG